MVPNISEIASHRVAIVTGAAQGIGRSIALKLASDGLNVAVVDLQNNLGLLDDLSKEIEKMGRVGLAICADISKEDEVAQMVQKTVDKFGKLDVMIANAGIQQTNFVCIADANIDEWEKVWKVNIRGTALCYKYAAIQMIAQGKGGRIIGASSVTGKKGYPGMAGYSASKFAIRGLTQSSAEDLAKHNITVNAYSPSSIDTPMIAEMRKGWDSNKKIGTPESVASAVSYLASPDAHFISGQTLNICGTRIFD